MIGIPLPPRPNVKDPRAKKVLEWAETAFYVFCLGFAAALLILLLIHGADFVARLPARL